MWTPLIVFLCTAGSASIAPRLGAPSLSQYDTLLVDCDGVLWRGSAAIDGSISAARALRAAGKRLIFVTNNSCKTRGACATKFAAFGLAVDPSEIVTSGSAAALYLASAHPAVRAAFVVGEDGLADELRQAGLRVVREEGEGARMGEEEIAAYALDPEVGAVVVGQDLSFSFRRLAIAALYMEQSGALLLGTNLDPFDMLPGGRRIPGAGCMVAAVSAACGVPAVAVGKPAAAMATTVLDSLALDPACTLIVGDRLDTDIALAASARLGGSCLCLSGCTSAAMVADLGALPAEQRPTFVVERFADLAAELAAG